MIPDHHLPEDLLLERSTAGLPQALDVLVASHLTLCPVCRAREAQFDGVGGAMLAACEPTSLSPGSLVATLARIAADPVPAPPTATPARDPVLPSPLLRFTGSFDAIPWSRRLLGCRRFDLPLTFGDRRARLLQFPAGWTLPIHTHEGVEHSLVLAGGYTDDGSHYQRGDVAIHAPGPPHRPAIDADGPCVLLLVHAGRLIPDSVWGMPAVWFVDG